MSSAGTSKFPALPPQPTAAVVCWPTHEPLGSEEPVLGVIHTTQGVIVDGDTGYPAVHGECSCLRLDLLGGEHAVHMIAQQVVPVEQV